MKLRFTKVGSVKIRVLSELTINQIAAGEVIENPASVVKELVENAIDAGSSQIHIEILGGGFQKIRVSDDGCGMSPDDAVLCLERHATSKIISAEDLFSLSTMGFRGEALASIAAISKMTLLSALENASAIEWEAEAGKILRVGPSARARGTTIEVRSLFFNVPARKKFQKSTAACSAEVTRVMTQLALGRPEVGFSLVQQGREIFSVPPLDSLQNRAGALLGKEFLLTTRPFSMNEKELVGSGLISDPLHSRQNRSGQYLFINRRAVMCLPIAYAVRDAYGTRLGSDRHPVYLLHLSIPAQLVDVNVHPQKREIRLKDESLLKYALHSAVNDALGSGGETMVFEKRPFETPPPFSAEPLILKAFEETSSVQEEMVLPSTIQAIGVHGRYLIVNAESCPGKSSGVVWVDLPAAEARVQFDTLMRHANDRPLSQGLLLPMTLSFSRADAQLIESHLENLQRLGFQVRAIGETVFLIEGTPPFISEGEIAAVFEDLIAELPAKNDALRRLAANISRRVHSRKKCYHLVEAKHIFEELIASTDPFHCPQGKLTLQHVKEEEIENYFK